MDKRCLNETEMLSFADTFAKTLPAIGMVALWGDLGAGKTTFVRQIIQSLAGCPDLIVQSPTFTLVQLYELPERTIWHGDLYRLTAPDECLELGLLEAMHNALCFIEWPDRMGHYLPQKRIDVHIKVVGDDREIVIE